MIGKIFDYTIDYSHNLSEVEKLLNYYFDKSEIKNKVILDAGCRIGDYIEFLDKMGAKKVIGVDLSKECIKVAKRRFQGNKKINVYQGNIVDLKMFKNKLFDVIFCIGTINYLNPEETKIALHEFTRVTKPGGIILILFQKEKGVVVQFSNLIANLLPLKIYLFLIEKFAFLFKPAVEKIIGRSISLNYLKYDILLSLRGIHFGLPLKINEKFRVKTIKCEQCSEETTASYKIRVIPSKSGV